MVELFAREGREEWFQCLEGHRLVVVHGVGREGVGAGIEHRLSKVGGVQEGGNSQVLHHGVRFPAAEELDVIHHRNVGAQECGGAARPEATGTEEPVADVGGGGVVLGGKLECLADVQVRGWPAGS
jgi:hypothetical protein